MTNVVYRKIVHPTQGLLGLNIQSSFSTTDLIIGSNWVFFSLNPITSVREGINQRPFSHNNNQLLKLLEDDSRRELKEWTVWFMNSISDQHIANAWTQRTTLDITKDDLTKDWQKNNAEYLLEIYNSITCPCIKNDILEIMQFPKNFIT